MRLHAPTARRDASHRRGRRGLRRRLVVLFLVVGTLPLALAGVLVTGSSYVGDRAQSLARQQDFTRDLAASFEAAIDEEIADVRTMARLVALADDDEARRVVLGAILARNPTFSEVSVLDAAGADRIRLSRAGPDGTTGAPPVDVDLPAMSPGSVDVAALVIDEASGAPSLDVVVRAPSVDLGTIGVRAEIVLLRAWEQLALRDTVGDATVYLLDEEDRIVAHPNPSLALAGRVHPTPTREGFGDGLTGDALITYERVTIENRGLLAVVERSSADVLGSFRRALYSRFAGVAAALVASALVGIYAARRITEPIETLADTAARLTDGDLAARAHLDRDDEIGLLGDTLDDMAAEIGRTIEDLEHEVAQRTDRLRRSNEELERFATVAAHDLREPLRKVETFGDRLTRSLGDDVAPDAAHSLARMTSAVTRMRDMIDDLLDYSTIGRQAAPYEPVDLDDVVGGALDDLGETITEVGATVTVGELPTVMGSRIQLRRLFVNLIENAVRYSRPDVPPMVEVGSTAADDAAATAVITVSDNGIGFDDEHRERIFEVFRRLHTQTEYPGTGIGLSICRRIVEQHGGTITARAGRRSGAAFDITLPLRTAHAPERDAVDTASPGPEEDARERNRSASADFEATADHRHGRRR